MFIRSVCNYRYYVLYVSFHLGNNINGGLQSPSSEMMETKVLLGNVPVAKRSERFISSYLHSLTNIDYSVKQYKDQFLAEFQGPIGKFIKY